MANRTVSVHPTGEGTGDASYTTLALAIAGEEKDLVTNTRILTIEIQGDWSGGADSTEVSVTGFTVSSSYYVIIQTDSANRHAGVWDTNKYVLEKSHGGAVFTLVNSYTRMIGLQIRNTATGDYQAFKEDTSGCDGWLMDKCLLRGGSGGKDILIGGGDGEIRNTGVFGNALGIYTTWSSENPTLLLQNVTAINSTTYCIQVNNGSVTANNVYAGGGGTADTSGTISDTNCASSDGTIGSAVACSTSSGAYFTNVTGDSEDVHIKSDSSLIGNGSDLSGTFTDDFEGDTRSAWDIGADEYIAAGGGSAVPIIMSQMRRRFG